MVSEERVIMPMKELRLIQVILQTMDKKLRPRHIRRLIERVEQEGGPCGSRTKVGRSAFTRAGFGP